MRTVRCISLLIAVAVACPLVDAQERASRSARQRDRDRVAWLAENAVRVRSIDPMEEDFADLEPLAELIGDARVVVLGEPTHGDGGSFYAKSRLFKFLHVRLGFDVILWESGLYDCRRMHDQFEDGLDWQLAAANGIGGTWSYSGHAAPVFEYVWNSYFTENPVTMGGFDYSARGAHSKRALPRDVMEFFAALNPHPFQLDDRKRLLTVLERFDEAGDDDDALVAVWDDVGSLITAIDEHRDALIAAHSVNEVEFWTRTLDDVLFGVERRMSADGTDRGQPMRDLTWNNERDRRMGEHLLWLVHDVFPDRRIVVWEATFHALREADAIETIPLAGFMRGVVTAGEHVSRGMGDYPGLADDMYIIGVTTGHGTEGRVGREPRPLQEPARGSFEELAERVGHPFLYVDLRSLPDGTAGEPRHWLREPLITKAFGLGQEMRNNGVADDMHSRADWSRQLDALLYVHTTFATNGAGRVPEGVELTVDAPVHE